MDSLRLDAVPARVVTWHNRHPLACRIAPAHVGSIGCVALPFAQAPGEQRLRRGFDEDFLDGAPPARVARWAARHGVAVAEAPPGVPLRVLAIAGSRFRPDDTLVTLYVCTALVDDGWRSSRLLIGSGDRPSVWGRRLPSRPRRSVVAAALAAAVGTGALMLVPRPDAVVDDGPAATDAAPASAVVVAETPEVAVEPPLAAVERPPDVEPRRGRVELPALKPALRVVEAPVRARPAPAWALTTRRLGSAAESDQVTVAMAALLQRAGLRSVKVQSLEVRGDWHVVGWPFPTRDAAENARLLLASRGLQLEAVEF